MFSGDSNSNQNTYNNRPVGGAGSTGQPPAPGTSQGQLIHQQPASSLFQSSQPSSGQQSSLGSQPNLNAFNQNSMNNLVGGQIVSGFQQQVQASVQFGIQQQSSTLFGNDAYNLAGMGGSSLPNDQQNQLTQQNQINMNHNLIQTLDNALAQDQFKFFIEHYQLHNKEKGNLYTWGSGEMGQLGYSSEVITKMPKDREGYPFQPYPLEIMQLRNKGIYQIAGGDGHTVAVDIKGNVYSWGASACGQLGLQSMKDLPTDVEGYPYQPTPRLIELLLNVKIIQIACGDAHTVALTSEGRLYSWGGGGCGQLGHPDTQCMPKDEDGCPYQPKPKMIQDLKSNEVKEVSCGKAHTVAVLRNGHLYSWGAGACGQLGHPDTQTFPADEDGYPYQPIPRLVNALSKHKLIHASCGDVHTMVLSNQGEIYCFGGGSCGQLGFGNISAMPLDVDSCPFMPVPKKIESLQNQFVIQLACGDSHSMALTKEGLIYAWGEATYGQLGLDDTKDLLKNTDSKPYQPFPTKVAALQNKKVVAISCGETHTLALTDSGHLYSFGANGCGQLGQFCCEYEKRRRDSFEDIVLPKMQNINGEQYSFMSGAGSDGSAGDASIRDEPQDEGNNKQLPGTFGADSQNVHMAGASPLMSPPPLYSTDDYKIDGMQLTPKLVKSLMHRKVIKISSGGVHNICIVEPQPNSIQEDVYKQFMESLYGDVIFKGFYQTFDDSLIGGSPNNFNGRNSSNINAYNPDQFGGQNQVSGQMSQHSLSDNEEMRDGGSAGSGSQSLHHSGNDINIASQDIRIHQENNQILARETVQPQNHMNRLNRRQTDQKNMKKIDDFWKPKSRSGCNVEIQAHMGIIASKSKVLTQFLLEQKASVLGQNKEANSGFAASSLASGNGKHKKLVIDFKYQVNYQAFRKIVDYCYLGNINILNQISDSTEMIEIIKLSSHFGLARLLKAAQSFCQNHMMNFMESSFTCLSLKNVSSQDKKKATNVDMKYSHLNHGAQNNDNRPDEPVNLGNLGNSNNSQIVSQSSNAQRERGLQSRGAQQQQSSKKNMQSSGQMYTSQHQAQVQRNKNKNQFTPQGIMFLPDGKVLIMDPELYKQTIERSFVIDLIDQQINGDNSLDGNMAQAVGQNGNNLQIEDQSSLTNIQSRNNQKEIIRKPSQANQKRIHRQGQDSHSMHNFNSSSDNPLNSSDQQNQPNDSLQNIGGLASITEEGTSAQNHRDAYNIMRAGHNNDLQKDFISIFDEKDFSDVTLVVENKQIYCHQVILASRSTYFEALFTHDFSEKDLRVVDFNESGISYEQLMRLLKHIYSDNLKIESKFIYDLLSLADRYDIQSIKRKCEQIFAQHISVDTLCQIFKYACQFNCERLKETCLLFTEENHQDVLTSTGFEDLEREEMIQIVRVGKDASKKNKPKVGKR